MRRFPLLHVLTLASLVSLPVAASAPWVGRVATPRHLDVHVASKEVLTRLDARVAKLDLSAAGVTQTVDGDRFVSFTQRHLGVPVLGAGATVRLNAQGEALLATQRFARALPASATPAVSVATAIAAAETHTKLKGSASAAKLLFRMVDEDDVRLVYVLRMSPRFPLVVAPQAIVDAMSGEVLEVRDLAVRAKANMYETNPVKSSLAARDFAIAPTSTQLISDVVETSNCIDDKRVASVDFGFGGPTNVHVCSLVRNATANSDGDFLYTPVDDASNPARDSDEFSEVSMYFHATKAYAFFRGLRGEAQAQVVNDKPLRTISNLRVPAGIQSGNFSTIGDPNIALEPFQNAFFSPGGEGDIFSSIYGYTGGAMWFGQGPTHDYSYDGDVVYHEFTHGVVDATLKLEQWVRDEQGAIDAPGAMNEGLADYFSSAISGDADVGEYASKDIDPSMNVIRTLANTDTCPGDVGGQVHHDSTFWSGGLWSARTSLPAADRTTFDRAVYKAMLANAGRGSLNFEEMTGLITAVLATDLPAGKTALEAAMRTRGAFPACDRTLTFTGNALNGPDDLGGAFMAPGRQDLTSFRPVAPGIMTFRYDLPAYTNQVTVRFSVGQSGGGGFGGGGTPFTPKVFARFDSRIAWTKSGANLVATDALSADPTKQGSAYNASFEVPEGAKAVYVQIANSGQSSGMYKGITFSSTQGEAPPVVDAGADASTETPQPARVEGCGCTVVGSTPTPKHGLAALALGLAALVRRRRSAKR
jgi:MYXO-CTERM domain-containing protein